ncbi:hypothetical protein Lser_V15G11778 [Lactuca serriola]
MMIYSVLKSLGGLCGIYGSAARVILVPSICDAHHEYVFPQ